MSNFAEVSPLSFDSNSYTLPTVSKETAIREIFKAKDRTDILTSVAFPALLITASSIAAYYSALPLIATVSVYTLYAAETFVAATVGLGAAFILVAKAAIVIPAACVVLAIALSCLGLIASGAVYGVSEIAKAIKQYNENFSKEDGSKLVLENLTQMEDLEEIIN